MPRAIHWPSGAVTTSVLAVRVKCTVDELFRVMFTSPELSERMHKLRADANLVETAWVASKEQLPQPQFTWTQPPADGGSNADVGLHRWRKVRFESAPSALATKPFQNEELQHVSEHHPGRSYEVELQANTTAPYGDKFDVLIRVHLLADLSHHPKPQPHHPCPAAVGGAPAAPPATSLLHVVFFTNWSPSMNSMMKAMISKAVDSGVRGSYKTLRQVLEATHAVEDVQEVAVTHARTALAAAVGGAAAVELRTREAPATPAAVEEELEEELDVEEAEVQGKGFGYTDTGAADWAARRRMPPAHPLTFVYHQLVWGEQVSALSDVVGASLRSAAAEGLVARIMAVVVTLSLVHLLVVALSSMQQACSGPRGVVAWVACLPVTHMVDLPDSLGEVLVALALVAAANWAVVWLAYHGLQYVARVEHQHLAPPPPHSSPPPVRHPQLPPGSAARATWVGPRGRAHASAGSSAFSGTSGTTAAAATAATTSGPPSSLSCLSAFNRIDTLSLEGSMVDGLVLDVASNPSATLDPSTTLANGHTPPARAPPPGSPGTAIKRRVTRHAQTGDAGAAAGLPLGGPPAERNASSPSLRASTLPASAQGRQGSPAQPSSPAQPALQRTGRTAIGKGAHANQVFGAQYPPGYVPPPSAFGPPGPSGPEPMLAWIKTMSDSIDAMAEGFKGALGIKDDSADPPGAAGRGRLPSHAGGASNTTIMMATPGDGAVLSPPSDSQQPDGARPARRATAPTPNAATAAAAVGSAAAAVTRAPGSAGGRRPPVPMQPPGGSCSGATTATAVAGLLEVNHSSASLPIMAHPTLVPGPARARSPPPPPLAEGDEADVSGQRQLHTSSSFPSVAVELKHALAEDEPPPASGAVQQDRTGSSGGSEGGGEGRAGQDKAAGGGRVSEGGSGAAQSPKDCELLPMCSPTSPTPTPASAHHATLTANADTLVPAAVAAKPSLTNPSHASHGAGGGGPAAMTSFETSAPRASSSPSTLDQPLLVAWTSEPAPAADSAQRQQQQQAAGEERSLATRSCANNTAVTSAGGLPSFSGPSRRFPDRATCAAGAMAAATAVVAAGAGVAAAGDKGAAAPAATVAASADKSAPSRLGAGAQSMAGLFTKGLDAAAAHVGSLRLGGDKMSHRHTPSATSAPSQLTHPPAHSALAPAPVVTASPLSAFGFGRASHSGSAGPADLISRDGPSLTGATEGDPAFLEEEVFENERFQPFRGWGHTWPGHFLPSDRVGHWSDVQGGPGGTASMIFEQVEPQLPPAWDWLDEEWQLDMDGQEVEAVDEQGWSYALDFNYLRHPPPPQAGKCTLKHFVRRRRWVRTRVRRGAAMLPAPAQQEMVKPQSGEPLLLLPAATTVGSSIDGGPSPKAGGQAQLQVEGSMGNGALGSPPRLPAPPTAAVEARAGSPSPGAGLLAAARDATPLPFSSHASGGGGGSGPRSESASIVAKTQPMQRGGPSGESIKKVPAVGSSGTPLSTSPPPGAGGSEAAVAASAAAGLLPSSAPMLPFFSSMAATISVGIGAALPTSPAANTNNISGTLAPQVWEEAVATHVSPASRRSPASSGTGPVSDNPFPQEGQGEGLEVDQVPHPLSPFRQGLIQGDTSYDLREHDEPSLGWCATPPWNAQQHRHAPGAANLDRVGGGPAPLQALPALVAGDAGDASGDAAGAAGLAPPPQLQLAPGMLQRSSEESSGGGAYLKPVHAQRQQQHTNSPTAPASSSPAGAPRLPTTSPPMAAPNEANEPLPVAPQLQLSSAPRASDTGAGAAQGPDSAGVLVPDQATSMTESWSSWQGTECDNAPPPPPPPPMAPHPPPPAAASLGTAAAAPGPPLPGCHLSHGGSAGAMPGAAATAASAGEGGGGGLAPLSTALGEGRDQICHAPSAPESAAGSPLEARLSLSSELVGDGGGACRQGLSTSLGDGGRPGSTDSGGGGDGTLGAVVAAGHSGSGGHAHRRAARQAAVGRALDATLRDAAQHTGGGGPQVQALGQGSLSPAGSVDSTHSTVGGSRAGNGGLAGAR